jgi:high affinity Mn2+ porin
VFDPVSLSKAPAANSTVSDRLMAPHTAAGTQCHPHGRWSGRPDDTVGLAGAINRISHQGKLYLAAGGLGGISGDGQLPNAGPEQIVEAHYNVALFSFAHFTVEYQFIKNPAYNRDRGPVSVCGPRLHVQY